MSRGFGDAKMAPPAPPAAPQTSAGACVLGPTLHFKGELYGEEDLEFQGQLEGSIEHTRSLSIGKEGGVTGNIRAKFVIVEGRVDGDIYASESVSIFTFPRFSAGRRKASAAEQRKPFLVVIW